MIPATSTPEVCDGIDNDCDGLLNENPGVLCDDGYDCTADSCQNYGYGFYGCLNPMPSTCQEIQRPVAESRIAADGVTWLMRRDNPRLRGRAIARVDYEGWNPGYYGYRRIMSPVASAIIGNGYTNIEPGNPSAGWLYSENAVGAATAIGNFRAPWILMNLTGPTEIALYRFPGASGPYQWLDQIRMEMDPNVLVVPVRATVFVPSATPTATANWTEAMRQVFEPGMVATTSFSTTATTATAESRETLVGYVPDDIWTQCDIQFRLVATRVEPNPTLAATVATTCTCRDASGVIGNIGARTPLGTYVDLVGGTNQNAIDIFVGDQILDSGVGCNSSTRGFACGPSVACNNIVDGTNGHIFRGIVVESTQLDAIPHELGHMLGLGHAFTQIPGTNTRAEGYPCAPGGGTLSDNLMGSLSDHGPLLPAQCTWTRCMAARWINRFSPSTAAQAREEALCAGL